MKKPVLTLVHILFLFAFMAFAPTLTASAVIGSSVGNPWKDSRAYNGDLGAAVNASHGAKLLVSAPTMTLQASSTTPADVQIEVTMGGLISLGTSTLTIDGPFSAGPYQIFTGTGVVVFGPGSVKEVLPQWFGANGLQAAVNAAVLSGLPVHIMGTIPSGPVIVPSLYPRTGSLRIIGDNMGAMMSPTEYPSVSTNVSRIVSKAGSRDLFTGGVDAGVATYIFENIIIQGPDTVSRKPGTSGDGINLSKTRSSVRMRNVEIYGFNGANKAGLRLVGGFYNHLDSVRFVYNHFGLYVDSSSTGDAAWNVNTLSNVIFRSNIYGARIIGSNGLTGSSALFENNEKTGLELSYCLNHVWTGTYFENNNTSDTAGEYALKIYGKRGQVNQHITFFNTQYSLTGTGRTINRVYIGGEPGGGSLDVRLQDAFAAAASDEAHKFITIDRFATDTMIENFRDNPDPLYGISDLGTRTVVKLFGIQFKPPLLSGTRYYFTAVTQPSAAQAPDVSKYDVFDYKFSRSPGVISNPVNVVSDPSAAGTARGLTTPLITIRVRNQTGSTMSVTMGNLYRFTGAPNFPAPANNAARSITFQFDGSSWLEISRTQQDVPL